MNRIAHEKAAAQCVEEAALLWLRREHLLGEPHLSLPDFVERDSHLQARLDELVSAGELGWKACERELGWEEPGEIFPATYLALSREGSADHLARVMDYAVRSPELARPMVAALAWKPLDEILDFLEDLLTADEPRERRIGLGAAIAHRQVPEFALSDAVVHADQALQACALRGVGEMGCVELLPCVAEQLASGPHCCQFAAAWTCALRARLPAAVTALLDVTREPGVDAERAVGTVVRTMNPGDATDHVRRLSQDAALQRVAAIGAGALGDPVLVDWLISQLDQPLVARVAGEALTMITGLPLDETSFQTLPPDAPWNDADHETIEFGPDEHLPWPSQRILANWWIRHRQEFHPGRRYLLGRPIEEAWCRQILRCGLQRQRAGAALELAVRQPAEPLFEVRAPAWRQQSWLADVSMSKDEGDQRC